eukprot:8045223-Lingulodinium_polyedra.AAC.1
MAMAMKLGVFKSVEDSPLWGAGKERKDPLPKEGEQDEEAKEEKTEKEAAEALQDEAKKAGKEARKEGEAE